jgi:2-methylcitrate dehydratase PrpD
MSQTEQTLANFICSLKPEQVPPAAQRIVRLMAMAVIGTGIAGAGEDGIAALREMLLEAGGAPQATTFVFGDKLPAAAAAQFNATMCRALDFCDAMAPGPHLGAAIFPAALAAAELMGGCSGAEFFAALAAGAETASRFNLSEAQYNGVDPTGIAVVFGAAAAASRVMRLTPEQTLHALALAFNRCAGSFQSNVDGSLAVRVIQGWVAQAGVQCAQMAKRGITGPVNFLTGHYGFAHLFGRGTLGTNTVVAGLGQEWRLTRMVFKKYPSCGVTQGVTELALALVTEAGLKATDVERAEVRLPPYAHRLVGHTFAPGANPRVDAQFSAAYCVANAFVRQSSRLQHFTPAEVANPQVNQLISRIQVLPDHAMDTRGHTSVDLDVLTRDGKVHKRALDIAPGFPGADLTDAQHEARFRECMAYASQPLSDAKRGQVLAMLQDLPGLPDVRVLAGLLS